MQAQLVTLVIAKAAGPGPDRDRKRQFADVMNPSGAADRQDLGLWQTRHPGGAFAQLRHGAGMADAVRHPHVDHVRHHKAGGIDLGPRHLAFLGVEGAHHLGFRRAVKTGHKLCVPGQECRGKRRIIGAALAPADQGGGLNQPEGIGQQDGVLRQGHDPHRQGDVGAGAPMRQALAVPAFVQLAKATADGFRQAKAVRDAFGHLAMARQDGTAGTGRLQEALHQRQGRRLHRCPRRPPHQSLDHKGQHFGRAAIVDQRKVAAEGIFVAQKGAHQMAVGVAADIAQQRLIEDR